MTATATTSAAISRLTMYRKIPHSSMGSSKPRHVPLRGSEGLISRIAVNLREHREERGLVFVLQRCVRDPNSNHVFVENVHHLTDEGQPLRGISLALLLSVQRVVRRIGISRRVLLIDLVGKEEASVVGGVSQNRPCVVRELVGLGPG
jgi:hypothetical protein